MKHFLLLLIVAAGCGDDGSSNPLGTPRETFTDSKMLLVGELAEGELTGGLGDTAVIRLSAPLPKLDWNIHGHANGGTQVVDEDLGVMSLEYTFQPDDQADWSLLIRNQDAEPMTVEVEIELYAGMEWTGWE